MKKLALPIIVLLFVAVLSGCSSPKALPRIFWPPPPGDTALEFVGLFYSDMDFPKTGMESFLEAFLGGGDGVAFSRPTGIAGDGEGRVYVADSVLRVVRVFDLNQRSMHVLTKEAVFSMPADLAIDSQKRLYVVDGGAQRVTVFSLDGGYLFSFGSSDLFVNPAYIAINERLGRIYVSDGKGHQIVVFDMSGKHLFSIGKLGGGPGEFYSPQGLAIDRDNRIFVADQFNARIQVLDADGKYIRHFGERGDGKGQMEMPKGLAFDSDGHLYVVDTRKASLTVYTPEGEPFLYLGGGKSWEPLGFANPAFISIDGNDRVYITDMLTRRFVMWQYLNPTYLKAHPITREDLEELESLKMKNPVE